MRVIELLEEHQSTVVMQARQLIDSGKPVYISIQKEQIDGTVIKTAVFAGAQMSFKLVKNSGLNTQLKDANDVGRLIFFNGFQGDWMSVNKDLVDDVLTIEKNSAGDWVVTPVK